MSQADDLQARTDAFADLSLRFIDGLPNSDKARRLAGQYQDASTSTAANYRAARRARSHAEFTSKIGIVSEEADESVFWLKRMLNANSAARPPRSNRCSPRPKNLPESLAGPIARPNAAARDAITTNDSIGPVTRAPLDAQ